MRRSERDAIVAALDCRMLVAEWGLDVRRPGSQHFVRCPWHAEKTPSCLVEPDHLHCFGCGRHASAFDLHMRLHGGSYREAFVTLAERAGVALDPPTVRKRRRRHEPEAQTGWTRAERARFLRILGRTRRLVTTAYRDADAMWDALARLAWVEVEVEHAASGV